MTSVMRRGLCLEITIHFHWQLLLALVILPTTFFMLLAMWLCHEDDCRTPALRLLEKVSNTNQGPKEKEGCREKRSPS